jgi:hypothetical protein
VVGDSLPPLAPGVGLGEAGDPVELPLSPAPGVLGEGEVGGDAEGERSGPSPVRDSVQPATTPVTSASAQRPERSFRMSRPSL